LVTDTSIPTMERESPGPKKGIGESSGLKGLNAERAASAIIDITQLAFW